MRNLQILMPDPRISPYKFDHKGGEGARPNIHKVPCQRKAATFMPARPTLIAFVLESPQQKVRAQNESNTSFSLVFLLSGLLASSLNVRASARPRLPGGTGKPSNLRIKALQKVLFAWT